MHKSLLNDLFSPSLKGLFIESHQFFRRTHFELDERAWKSVRHGFWSSFKPKYSYYFGSSSRAAEWKWLAGIFWWINCNRMDKWCQQGQQRISRISGRLCVLFGRFFVPTLPMAKGKSQTQKWIHPSGWVKYHRLWFFFCNPNSFTMRKCWEWFFLLHFATFF